MGAAKKFLILLALTYFKTLVHMSLSGVPRTSRIWKYKASTKQTTLAELLEQDNIQGRIAGGQVAGSRKIPHQLYFTDKDAYNCGAALVEVYAVHIAITATHCLWIGSPRLDTLKNPKNLKVFAGIKKRSAKNSVGRQTRGVVKIVPSPKFGGEYWTDDIAVMFLTSNFWQTRNVQPLILPGFDWDLPHEVFVSGWGSNSFGAPLQDDLKFVVLPVVDYHTCLWLSSTSPWNLVTDNQFCVGHLGDFAPITGTCGGDSGGPGAAWNRTANVGYLAGIISYGMSHVCGDPNFPTVYTRVSKYTDWIRIEVSKYKEGLATGKR